MNMWNRYIRIFCSYSHKDLALKNELAKHIENPLIVQWSDSKIDSGMEWEKEIYENLKAADIILLLISPDFKVSRYCVENEMKLALEREKEGSAYVIPIMLRPVNWANPPYRYLHMPNSGQAVTIAQNRDLAFAEIAKEVDKTIEKVQKRHSIQAAGESMAAGRLQEAYVIYQQGLKYASEDAILHGEAGDLLVALKRYEEALAAYQQAVKLKPGDFALYKRLGDTFSLLERPNDALEKYREALGLPTDDYQQYIDLGNTLYTMDSYPDALIAYNLALSLKDDDAEIYMHKGKICLALEKYADALVAYEHVIALNPDDPRPYIDKAYILVERGARGDHELALQAYDEALHLDNNDAQIWRDKGDVLVKLGRLEEAYGVYGEAISRTPNNAFLYKDRADILFKLGRYEEARNAYSEAIRRKSDIKMWYVYRADATRKFIEELTESERNDRRIAGKMK